MRSARWERICAKFFVHFLGDKIMHQLWSSVHEKMSFRKKEEKKKGPLSMNNVSAYKLIYHHKTMYFYQKRGKINLWGAKIWAFELGLKPHLLTRTRPRRRKCWERPYNMWLYREMLKDTNPKGSYSSNLTNVSQVNFTLT